MGNSKSKAAKAELNEKLDVAEKKHAAAAKTILVREEELERCKREAATSTAEADSLKAKTLDLEARIEALQREQTAEVEGLKNELARELEGQVRIHESLTQERNRERKRADQLESKIKDAEKSHSEQFSAAGLAQEEKIKALKQEADDAKQQAEVDRKKLQDTIEVGKKDLDDAKAQTSQLEEKVLALEQEAKETNHKLFAAETAKTEIEQKHTALSNVLASTQSQLKESETTRGDLETKYNSTLTPLNSQLETLNSDLTASQQKQKDLSNQVTTMQKKADLAESKRSDLEKKYNESVSKKSALHEAFEATKMELKDSYQRYSDLHKEHSSMKSEVESLRAEMKAMKAASESEKKPEESAVNGAKESSGAVLAAQTAMDAPKAPGVSVEELKTEQATV